MSHVKRLSVLLLLCLLLSSCQSKHDQADTLQFCFLDVGQGDSLLLRTPDGDVLIDAGTEESEELLCLRLEELGVKRLRLVVLTHGDNDHIGGADEVLSRFAVDALWLNGAPLEGESGERLSAVLAEKRLAPEAVLAGRSLQVGGAVITALTPFAGNVADGNAGSIVLKIGYGACAAILSGDADTALEKQLVSRYGRSVLDCTLYKVGHHGSAYSSDRVFLNMMTPDYAVISCGAANLMGHPSGEALARLRAVGAEVLRTDLEGEICFTCDGEVLKPMR